MTAPLPAPRKRPAFEPAERLLRRPDYDPDMKRPTTTVAGVLLVLLRVVAGVLWVLEVSLHWRSYAGGIDAAVDGIDLSPEALQVALALFVIVSAAVLVVDAILAVLIYRGSNWARVVVMAIGVISISSSFAAWWAGGQEITLRTSLPALALDILVLLALSSRSAAAYARRRERR